MRFLYYKNSNKKNSDANSIKYDKYDTIISRGFNYQ